MAVKWTQAPTATLDYSINWASELVGSDILIDVSFTADTGLNVVSSNIFQDIYATVWVNGPIGTYNVDCHVTTLDGRQDDRTFQIVVKDT